MKIRGALFVILVVVSAAFSVQAEVRFRLLKDVEPSGGSYPWQFAKWGNAVYFMASDASYQTELWRTDGTDTGTLPVKTFDNVGMTAMKLAASQLYLFTGVTAQGRAIWRSDGTEAGTRLVKVLVPPSGTSSSIYVAVIGDLAFWCGDDGVNGKELWRSDGTEAGTFMLKRINAGGDTHPANLMVYQGMLYFSADEGSGVKMWRTDGAIENTQLFMNVAHSAETAYGWEQPYAVYKGILYFEANDGVSGYELWRSDGTASGTYILKNIVPDSGEGGSSAPRYFCESQGILYFSANSGKFSPGQLYGTDGSSEGTTLVTNSLYNVEGKVALNGIVYFCGSDSSYFTQGPYGSELFKSDGAAAGTGIVKDITPGGSSYIDSIVSFDGAIYFTITGTQLWTTDGTSGGTTQLNPGGCTTFSNLTVIGDKMYFGGDDGTHGVEPWVAYTDSFKFVALTGGGWKELGTPLELRAIVSGQSGPTAFRWYRDGHEIEGATAATYSVGAVTSDNGGLYTCVATDEFGPHESGSVLVEVVPLGSLPVTSLASECLLTLFIAAVVLLRSRKWGMVAFASLHPPCFTRSREQEVSHIVPDDAAISECN